MLTMNERLGWAFFPSIFFYGYERFFRNQYQKDQTLYRDFYISKHSTLWGLF